MVLIRSWRNWLALWGKLPDVSNVWLVFNRDEPIEERIAGTACDDLSVLESRAVQQATGRVELPLVVREVHNRIPRINVLGELALVRNGVKHAIDFYLERFYFRVLNPVLIDPRIVRKHMPRVRLQQ